MNASIRLTARALLALGMVLMLLTDAVPAAGIEDELVGQTPVSAFIVETMLKEFTVYAKEKWNVGLRTRAQRAGTPVSYERIVGWKGQPEADIFWGGGELALFNSLAQQGLLTKLEVASASGSPSRLRSASRSRSR